MWIFTPDGFYSVVAAAEFGEPLQVRARCRPDLDRLRQRFLPELGEPVHIPGRDYPWRAFTSHEALAAALGRIALAVDYPNFKAEVAHRRGPERAHVYGRVWSVCLAIEGEGGAADDDSGGGAAVQDRREPEPGPGTGPVPERSDRTAEYEARDLHDEGVWPLRSHVRYGGVVFDRHGRVLLREPAGHFDGYVWTFPKGRPDPGEHPARAALRETLEETGRRPWIVGHIAAGFRRPDGGPTNYLYLMLDAGEVDEAAMAANGETAAVRWADEAEARRLIGLTTNPGGRARDLRILEAAFVAYRA